MTECHKEKKPFCLKEGDGSIKSAEHLELAMREVIATLIHC